MVAILLRQGDRARATRIAETIHSPINDMIRASLKGAPQSEIHKHALQGVTATSFRDCETPWLVSLPLAAAGERRLALQLLRQAVEKGYCAYPALDSDPDLASIRDTPEFRQIRRKAIECQARFLQFRSQLPP
jgi:hypothetical protein